MSSIENKTTVNKFFLTGSYYSLTMPNSLDFSSLNIKNNNDAFFTLLFHSGYLTKDDKDNYFKIPNEEVKIELMNLILPIWENHLN